MMKFTIEMLAARLKDLLAASRRERIPLEPARIACGALRGAQQRDYDDSTWQQIAVGDRWGGAGQTCWLRIPLRLPDAWAGHNVVVHIQLGDYESITGPEALAYLDGVPVQGFDFHHRELFLDERVSPAEEHLLALEAFSSLHQAPQTLRALELVRIDPEAEALYHDMRVLHGALLTMPPESIERARLLRALEHAYHALDMRRPLSDDYLRPVSEARAILQREVYAPEPAADSPRIVAVGHAHIDLAWLWPVAQTRRKGARTFSTVLKLMEQYPAYHFVASQPALYQMVREDEPALYARVKERIAEGRWEPTGATWVEMDCNVAGAEALVRQFLYGKRFFREELGADPKVLWLPDVFGYSAAMPQIMTGCGVDYFMTTKISWNEYNRLPHDTFRWRGIDGTEVLTHMVTAPLNPQEQFISTMQPFYTYNAKFTPYDVAGNWRAYGDDARNRDAPGPLTRIPQGGAKLGRGVFPPPARARVERPRPAGLGRRALSGIPPRHLYQPGLDQAGQPPVRIAVSRGGIVGCRGRFARRPDLVAGLAARVTGGLAQHPVQSVPRHPARLLHRPGLQRRPDGVRGRCQAR